VSTTVNIAAKVGSRVVFNCTAKNATGDFVTWDYISAKNRPVLPLRIYLSKENRFMTAGHEKKFAIEEHVTNNQRSYNLVINKVEMEHAMSYLCGFAYEGAKIVADLVALRMLRNFIALYNTQGACFQPLVLQVQKMPRNLASDCAALHPTLTIGKPKFVAM